MVCMDALKLKDCFPALTGNGEDVTDALQKALTWAGVGGQVRLPRGWFTLSATLYPPAHSGVEGISKDGSKLYRTGDYGNTIQCGDDLNSGGSFALRRLWLQHSISYTSGDTALANKATHGSHLAGYGTQNLVVEDCRLWRMPSAIYLYGGTLPYLNNNDTVGVFDHLYPACQEGFASVVFDMHSEHGRPQIAKCTNNLIGGANSALREVVINGHTVTMAENIGPQYGYLIYSLECGQFMGGLIGGQNETGFAISNKTGSVVSSISIGGGIELDSARNQQVLLRTQDPACPTVGFSMQGAKLIGENNGMHGVVILDNDGAPSLYDGHIDENTMRAHVGCPVILTGWVGGTFNGNTLTSYNALNVGDSDLQLNSAGLIMGASKLLRADGNTIGGGGNVFLPSGNPSNFCKNGLIIDPASVTLTNTIDAGLNP